MRLILSRGNGVAQRVVDQFRSSEYSSHGQKAASPITMDNEGDEIELSTGRERTGGEV